MNHRNKKGKGRTAPDSIAGVTGNKKMHKGLIGPLCIFAGIFCLLASVLPQAMNRYSEKQLLKSLKLLQEQEADDSKEADDSQKADVSQEAQQTDVKASPDEAFQKEAAAAAGRKTDFGSTAEGTEPPAGTVLGSLSIPAIGLEAPIREGSQRASLKDALGHLTGTAPIGSGTGNCAVAGHRNYTFGRFFNRLNEVKAGDSILVTAADGMEYTYVVTDIQVVEPEEVSVADSDGSGRLTLITCTPIYIATHRLIVSCMLVQSTDP